MFRSFSLFNNFSRFSHQHRLLLIFSLSIFFWQIFDGIITYFTPILITQRGFSNTQMGLIIGSSSVFGAILDFILAKVLKGSNYLRTFLIVLGISFFYPLTLWYSQSIYLYLLAMFIWGLYWDLYRFVSFDFVAHNSTPETNCFNFSIISLFRSIALILAPLIAGLLITDQVQFSSILIPSFFLIISAAFYIILTSLIPHRHHHTPAIHSLRHSLGLLKEFGSITKAAHFVLPVFFLNIILVTFDSTFWTLGPLLGGQFQEIKNFGGLLMTAYMLPGLFNSIFIDKLIDKFGKSNIAFFGFIFSGIFLIPVFLLKSPYLILLFVFIASVINTSSWPAVSGIFTDFIEKNPNKQKEFESLNDLSVNIGFVIGPSLAGIFADNSNLIQSLSSVSFFCVSLAVIVFYLSTRSVK